MISVEIILIISMLILMAAGYLLMDKLDGFLSGNKIEVIKHDEELDKILVYLGESDMDNLFKEIADINPRLVIAKEYEDYELRKYSAIIALSGNDADNLLLCVKANHLMAGMTTVAKCNESINFEIFEESGITRVITAKTEPDTLLRLLKGGGYSV